MSLLKELMQFCANNGSKIYYIAYSGGLDSHVLLSLMAKVRDTLPINIRAIHINHGLSPNAAKWQQHCKKVCRELNIELIIEAITVNSSNGASLEESAREQRYAIFADKLQADDILLTAHHQDDQAETFLLQLLRGAGVKGLSAMPLIKPFAQGKHARPLLSFRRNELLQYATEQQLSWIEDESNENKKFTRNFIRHDLLPLLIAREPATTPLLARSAAHCAEAQALLEEFAVADLQQCLGSRSNTLSVQQLSTLSEARQRLVLRTWIQSNGFRVPDHRRLASIMEDVLTAEWDRMPCVCWDGVELRRHGDDLFVMRTPLAAKLPSPMNVPNVGMLTFKFRTGSEVVRIPGRGSQSLKNLFQEWRVPPWERDRIPLLYLGEEIIAVLGYFVHPDFSYLQLLS